MPAQARSSGSLLQDLHPTHLIRNISTAIIIFLLEVMVVISFGALIFSGDLAGQVAYGIAFLAAGNAVVLIVVAILSSYPGSIAVEQDAPGAILAVATAAVVATLPVGASQGEKFSTVVVMIIATSFSTGLIFLLLGYFKLGGLVRFLPYPVMGGFLAGTGWLLLTGGIGIIVSPITMLNLIDPSMLARWLPGLVLGVVFLIVSRRTTNPLIMPAMFFVSVALFYLISRLAGIPQEQLQAGGWLLGSTTTGGRIWAFPLTAARLAQVNWQAIAGNVLNLAPAAIVSTIALLLNANGMELVAKRDINLNRELVAAGVANIFGSLVGGQIGYHTISFSSLNHMLTGGKRMVGVITGLLFAIMVLLSISGLSLLPRFALGGLVIYIGLALLFEWVFQAWYKFPKIDFLVILIILAIIALKGFMLGTLVGLVMTVIMFVVSYSQIDVIRHELTGLTFNSRVTRSHKPREILDQHGGEILILQLQGFIFFGTANRLYEQIQKRTGKLAESPVCYVILDFKHVSGLDSTGLLSFEKLLQLVEDRQISLVFTGLPERVARQFERGGISIQPGRVYFFNDLDHGVEWCENRVLASRLAGGETQDTLLNHLRMILPHAEHLEKLTGHMQRQEVAAGEAILHQNDDPDMVYFIERGQVTAMMESPGQEPVRLETMYGGRVVGEIGFYLGTKRSASVIADEPSVVYSLSRSGLESLEATHPDAANDFHRIIIHLLSERVTHLIRTVNTIQR